MHIQQLTKTMFSIELKLIEHSVPKMNIDDNIFCLILEYKFDEYTKYPAGLVLDFVKDIRRSTPQNDEITIQ